MDVMHLFGGSRKGWGRGYYRYSSTCILTCVFTCVYIVGTYYTYLYFHKFTILDELLTYTKKAPRHLQILTISNSNSCIHSRPFSYPVNFKQFLAHLSRRLKWTFLIKICPLSVFVVVVNFSHFHLLLQNHLTNFKQTFHNAL